MPVTPASSKCSHNRRISIALLLAVAWMTACQGKETGETPASVPEGAAEPAASASTELAATPFGQHPRECLHGHPSGARIAAGEGATEVTYPDGTTLTLAAEQQHCVESVPQKDASPTPSAQTGNWVDNVWYDSAEPLASFTGTYTVPGDPANGDAGQILYYFIGMENSGGDTTILQPVLAWGGNKQEGWNLSSWNCCPNGQRHHSEFLTGIQAGDTIEARIERSQTPDGSWDYTITGAWQGRETSLTVAKQDRHFYYGDVTLETYGASECGDFATGPITFSDMSMVDKNGVDLSPTWSTKLDGTPLSPGESVPSKCDGELTLVSESEITIQHND